VIDEAIASFIMVLFGRRGGIADVCPCSSNPGKLPTRLGFPGSDASAF